MSGRRLTEAAFLLPWVGVFLLTPPLLVIFQTWSQIAGFPLFIIYVFVCWFVLIVAGGVLCARLARLEDTDRPPERQMSRREPG